MTASVTSWTTVVVRTGGPGVAYLQADGVPCGGPLRVGPGGEAADELGDIHGCSVLDTAGIDPAGIDPAGIDPGDAALDGGDETLGVGRRRR